MAEFKPSLSPNVVALDVAVYSSPNCVASVALVSGSQTMHLNMFSCLPLSTGPADSP